MKTDRFLRFQHHIEEATSIGSMTLTYEDHLSRRRYYYDYNDLLERLGRLGLDLRQTPVVQRTYHLRRAMEQCNAIIYDRMLSAGNCSHPINPSDPLAGSKIAAWCPDITRHSLHLPLLHSRDKIQRIVRFVDGECITLPSRDRCPYKVVVEVLTEDSLCEQDALFAQYDRHLEPHQYWSVGAGALPDALDLDVEPNYSDGLTVTEYDADQIASSPARVALDVDTDEVQDSKKVLSDVSTKEAAAAKCSSPSVSVSDFQQEFDYRGGHSVDSNGNQQSSSTAGGSGGPVPRRVSRNSRPHSFTKQLGTTSTSRPQSSAVALDATSSSSSRISIASSAVASPAITTASAVATAAASPSARLNPFGQDSSYPFALPLMNSVQGRSVSDLEAMLRATSPFSHLPGWHVASFVVKTGDDVRKESLAMQLIEFMQEVFLARGIDIFLKPYQIVPTGKQSGLIEYLEGTISVDQIKKGRAMNKRETANVDDSIGNAGSGGSGVASTLMSLGGPSGNGHGGASVGSAPTKLVTLKEHFQQCFGLPYYMTYERAVKNFVRSLAGYSLVTYLLQVS